MIIGTNKLTRALSTFFLILPIILVGTGCALLSSKQESIDPQDKTVSVIFGHFDMKDAPSRDGIDWVTVKQYKPEKSFYSLGVFDKGFFWHIGVSKGSIQVERFGRNTRWYSNARYAYNFGGQGRNQTARIIKRPGVYFLGSYKYKHIGAKSFFKADNFKMIKTRSPTEKQLLTKMSKIMKESGQYSEYKHQFGMIQKRLRQLNKKNSR